MVGYQEIVTDPSYYGQIEGMSYPLIGNYGVNQDDIESRQIFLSGLVIKDYNDFPSNFRCQKELQKLLEENNVPLISDVDTRKMVRIIREKGSMPALITDALTPNDICFQKLQYSPDKLSNSIHILWLTVFVRICILKSVNRKNCQIVYAEFFHWYPRTGKGEIYEIYWYCQQGG